MLECLQLFGHTDLVATDILAAFLMVAEWQREQRTAAVKGLLEDSDDEADDDSPLVTRHAFADRSAGEGVCQEAQEDAQGEPLRCFQAGKLLLSIHTPILRAEHRHSATEGIK